MWWQGNPEEAERVEVMDICGSRTKRAGSIKEADRHVMILEHQSHMLADR